MAPYVPITSTEQATSANFSVSGAVWFLEPCSDKRISATLIPHLRDSLSTVLDTYLQWCSLTQEPYRPDLDHHHIHRFGRLQLSYGSSSDPGVELITAECPATLDVFVPKEARPAVWNTHDIPLESFIPQTELASPLHDPEDTFNPSVAIQITRKARIDNSSLPSLSVLFNPSLVDKQAAGDIDQPYPDPEIIKQAERLPLHRYDWWAPSIGCPWPIEVPAPFRSDSLEPAGQPLPWSEWGVTAPVSHYTFHLTGDQVRRIWQNVSSKSTTVVSRHDAVVAHIWSCISRARGLDSDEGLVHCDLVCGMHSRLSLGDDFIGSPTIMIDVAMKGSEACASDITPLATALRTTLTKLDRPSLQGHLYSVANEKSPQRIWQAFLGMRHILVTSWVHAGVYNPDFGGGMAPRYVEAIIPDMDGLVELKEAPPDLGTQDEEVASTRLWTYSGVDISVRLRSDVMERLLQDPYLLS